MKSKNIIVIIIVIMLLTIFVGDFMWSSHAYDNWVSSINISDLDGRSLVMYVDNTEVTSLSEIPANYIVDQERSYCFIGSPNSVDNVASIYTSKDGKLAINNMTKGSKCFLYYKKGIPTSYWFDFITCTQSNPCTHPNYGGTLQSSGAATNHNVYIGQDSSKYYACGTIQGHEICLSQPYTQYGLSGHTYCTDVNTCGLTSAQQGSAKQAIYQVFIDEGITVNINNDCGADSSGAYCRVGGLNCGLSIYGYVNCGDGSADVLCAVDASGHASCNAF